MARSKQSEQERTEFLDAIKADFDARLARLAADPHEWVTFLETVAEFGAQYTLNNQFLLLMQAERREMTPTFFLPFGNKAGTSGWKKYGRRVRAGETAFSVWAPIRRRPGWTPKSLAICSTVTPGSRSRATRTTSSRNSRG